MEHRTRTGIAYGEPLDESRRSDLLERGKDMSRRPVPAGTPLEPAPTWRPLAGASANNRGQARIVTLDTTLGQAALRVPSIVESPRGMGSFDGELISVRLGMDLPAPIRDFANGYSGCPVDVTCLLEFGVGGVSYTAELDWNQGTVFGVAASFVRVSALVGAIPILLLPPINITLQASLAYGDASNSGISAEARRTLNLGGPAGGGNVILPGATSAVFPIPFWAVGFTLTDAGSFPAGLPIAPDYTVTLFDDAANFSALYKVVSRNNTARQIEGQFPIPGRSRFIAITNNLGVSMKAPRLIFNLSL